jgi:TonB family protein
MPTQEAQRTEKFLIRSFVAHLVLFALLFTSTKLFPSTAKMYLPAIQVDMVALPSDVKTDSNQAVDTTLPIKENTPPPLPKVAEKAPEPTPAPLPAAKAPPTPKLKNPEVAAESAIEKLKKEVAKAAKAEKQEKQEKKKEDLQKFQERYRAANRGNQLHQGTNMSGTMEATVNAYGGAVTARLQQNWALPAYLQSEKLRASVVLYINASGQITNFRFTQKSGNDAFDNCVETTIQHSSPLPPPPADIAPSLRSGGMEVLFPI